MHLLNKTNEQLIRFFFSDNTAFLIMERFFLDLMKEGG